MKKILILILIAALFCGCVQVQVGPETQTTQPRASSQETEPSAPASVSPGKILHLGMHTDQSRGLWAINTDGTNLKKLVSQYVDAIASPDSSKIIYVYSKSIFEIRPDGSNKREVEEASGAVSNLRFSPDGRYIMYMDGNKVIAESMIDGLEYELTGSKPDQPSTGSSPAYCGKDSIVFISGKNIYRADIETETTETWMSLSNPQALQASPSAVYLSFSDSGSFWIAKNEKNSADRTEVAKSTVTNYEWSPDSKKIVYETTGGRFYIYDVAGKTSKTVEKDSEDRFSWSPDSQGIAFTYKDPVTYEDIWFVKADGTGLQKFTNCPTACEKPFWTG
jgi:Tol biopolymer transport system component